MTHVIRGRSIDGTVWFCGDNAWAQVCSTNTEMIGVREFSTAEEGEAVAKRLREANKGREMDEYIGHIEVVTKPTPTEKPLTSEDFLNRFDSDLLNVVNREIEAVKKVNPTWDHYRAVGWAIEGVSEARELPGEIINALRYHYEDGDDEDEGEARYFESQLRAIEQRNTDRPEDVDEFYERTEREHQ